MNRINIATQEIEFMEESHTSVYVTSRCAARTCFNLCRGKWPEWIIKVIEA